MAVIIYSNAWILIIFPLLEQLAEDIETKIEIMSKQPVIPILVDDFDELETRSILPKFDKALQKIVNVKLETLQKNVNDVLKGISSILSNTTSEFKNFEIDTVLLLLTSILQVKFR